MHQDHDITTGNRTRYREWAPTQPSGPAVERTRLPHRVRGTGPWLAAAPMLAVMGLTVGTALVVGATTRAAAPPQTREPAVAGTEQMRRQALALQAFRAHDYAMAYGRFAALADAGDAPSALMALAMLRHGPTLFGSDWSVTPGQLHRWGAIALREVHDHGLAIAQHDRGE